MLKMDEMFIANFLNRLLNLVNAN